MVVESFLSLKISITWLSLSKYVKSCYCFCLASFACLLFSISSRVHSALPLEFPCSSLSISSWYVSELSHMAFRNSIWSMYIFLVASICCRCISLLFCYLSSSLILLASFESTNILSPGPGSSASGSAPAPWKKSRWALSSCASRALSSLSLILAAGGTVKSPSIEMTLLSIQILIVEFFN
jgi:hypothetical protein